VHDTNSDAFGPGKFLGYRGMDFAIYAEARAGNSVGAKFDGHLSRVAIEAVADDRVEPGAQPRCAGRCDRDRHEGAGNENGGGRESAPPFAPEKVDDGRQAGVEGGLLDQHGDPGQHTSAGQT